jgi:hypothetical protein
MDIMLRAAEIDLRIAQLNYYAKWRLGVEPKLSATKD